MKTYVRDGDRLSLAAPVGGVVSGRGYLIGSIFGVAAATAAAGVLTAFQTEGVIRHAKAAGAVTVGAKMYWDNTAFVVTTVSSGNTFIGHATAAQGSGDATADVVLRPAGA